MLNELNAGLPSGSFTGRRPQIRLGSDPSEPSSEAVRQPLSAPPPTTAAVAPAPVGYHSRAAELHVTPLFLAVFHSNYEAVKHMLRVGSRVDVNEHVDASKMALAGATPVARLPHKPESALELAIAQSDLDMVELLMEYGAILQVPRQLSLEELRQKVKDKAAAAAAAPCSRAGSGGVRRGGQLDAFEDDAGVFSSDFLDDPEVQRTLGWKDYEAQLLTSTSPAIVERILKRQGYQLTLSMGSNPHELAQLFEKALAAGNEYVVEQMVSRGVDINAPTFRRDQFPLCVAINTLRPAMVQQVLKLGGDLHQAQVAAGDLYQPGAAPGAQRWYPLPDACLMLLNVAADAGWPDLQGSPVRDERFALAARVVEALLRAGAAPSDALVGRLSHHRPLNAAPPEAMYGYRELLRVLLGQRVWAPEWHAVFPYAFKEQVHFMLLCSGRQLSDKGLGVRDSIIEEGEEEEEDEDEEELELEAGESVQQGRPCPAPRIALVVSDPCG